jgi:cell wall-associated NlpC family hydrolase
VNHVGILTSAKNEPKQMIHASSSIGISIVNIEQSTYWQGRIVGYGRVINH